MRPKRRILVLGGTAIQRSNTTFAWQTREQWTVLAHESSEWLLAGINWAWPEVVVFLETFPVGQAVALVAKCRDHGVKIVNARRVPPGMMKEVVRESLVRKRGPKPAKVA